MTMQHILSDKQRNSQPAFMEGRLFQFPYLCRRCSLYFTACQGRGRDQYAASLPFPDQLQDLIRIVHIWH